MCLLGTWWDRRACVKPQEISCGQNLAATNASKLDQPLTHWPGIELAGGGWRGLALWQIVWRGEVTRRGVVEMTTGQREWQAVRVSRPRGYRQCHRERLRSGSPALQRAEARPAGWPRTRPHSPWGSPLLVSAAWPLTDHYAPAILHCGLPLTKLSYQTSKPGPAKLIWDTGQALVECCPASKALNQHSPSVIICWELFSRWWTGFATETGV